MTEVFEKFINNVHLCIWNTKNNNPHVWGISFIFFNSWKQMHTQGIPVHTQSFPVHTLVQTHSHSSLPIQSQAPQTVMITSNGGQSRFIQNPVFCHQSPAQGFQGDWIPEDSVGMSSIHRGADVWVIVLSSLSVIQPQMQSIMTSPQLQPLTIQHQRVLTQSGQTIQTLSTAPTTVHTVQQQVQQLPVSNNLVN